MSARFALVLAALPAFAVATTEHCAAGTSAGEDGTCVVDTAAAAAPTASKEHLLLQAKSGWVFRRRNGDSDASAPVETGEDEVSAGDQSPVDEVEPVDDDPDAGYPECVEDEVSRRRRAASMCSCRRRHRNSKEDDMTGYACVDDKMRPLLTAQKPSTCDGNECLCVFDIDRTLTGKQSATDHCPRNRELEFFDEAYGGGKATLSALANEGIATTFCNQCVLGITSAGHGSGPKSAWNAYILDNVMKGEKQDAFTAAHPDVKTWSHGTDVKSPFVLGQSNKLKQHAVELIRQWYIERDVCIPSGNVFFFGDRTENIKPFREQGLNSREISCGSRDRRLHHGGVGYCGATPEEIQRERGNILCE